MSVSYLARRVCYWLGQSKDCRMNNTPDQIKAAALSVMPLPMVAAEAELREIELAQADVCAKIAADQGVAGGARLESLNSEAARLNRSASVVRARIRECSVENATAVRDAMSPLRKAAARRIVTAIAELDNAIDCLNATGLALKEAGTPAVFMPAPLLDGMNEIAKSIIAASSPEQEKR
ncbi:hypothetical protein AB7M17_006126 [Bradyrhizobium sp. USDA 377]